MTNNTTALLCSPRAISRMWIEDAEKYSHIAIDARNKNKESVLHLRQGSHADHFSEFFQAPFQ